MGLAATDRPIESLTDINYAEELVRASWPRARSLPTPRWSRPFYRVHPI